MPHAHRCVTCDPEPIPSILTPWTLPVLYPSPDKYLEIWQGISLCSINSTPQVTKFFQSQTSVVGGGCEEGNVGRATVNHSEPPHPLGQAFQVDWGPRGVQQSQMRGSIRF